MDADVGASLAGRPRVVVSAWVSVDGRMTLGRQRRLLDEDTSRVWRSLQPASAAGLAEAREAHMRELHRPGAVLEGSGSFVVDGAESLTDLPADTSPGSDLDRDYLPSEVPERPGHESWFAVVDSRGRVPWEITHVGGADLLILVARSTPAAYKAFLRQQGICYLVAGEDRVDLDLALRRMHEELGILCVVSEAGGGLNGALLRAGLVDELQLLVVPALIGGASTPALFDGPELLANEYPTRLRLLSARTEADGMIWLSYEVDRTSNTNADTDGIR